MTKRVDEVRRVAQSRYWREDEARVVVEAWRESGLSLAAFARRYDLAPRRISRWVAALDAPARVRFHPVRLVGRATAWPQPEQGAAIEIVTPEGLRIRVPHGTAAAHLRQVLEAVGETGRC